MVLPGREGPSFTPIQNKRRKLDFCLFFNLRIFGDRIRERKIFWTKRQQFTLLLRLCNTKRRWKWFPQQRCHTVRRNFNWSTLYF